MEYFRISICWCDSGRRCASIPAPSPLSPSWTALVAISTKLQAARTVATQPHPWVSFCLSRSCPECLLRLSLTSNFPVFQRVLSTLNWSRVLSFLRASILFAPLGVSLFSPPFPSPLSPLFLSGLFFFVVLFLLPPTLLSFSFLWLCGLCPRCSVWVALILSLPVSLSI